MEAPQKKLDFARPPVDEVVLSVLIRPLDKLLAPHLGEIWKEFKRDGFGSIMEHPPVLPVVEMFSNSIQEPQLQISNRPDLARIWFIHEDDNQIIQVQRDRFTFNWRKTESNQQYPGFTDILKSFETFYIRFCKILTELEVGTLNPSQYELTYIDQIFQGSGWDALDDIGKIFNLFVDSQQLSSFWSGAESMILRTSFPLEHLPGRLHLTIGNRVKVPEKRKTLQAEFTLRGFPENGEHDKMITWFKSAHSEICKTFMNTFTEDIQTQVWERKS